MSAGAAPPAVAFDDLPGRGVAWLVSFDPSAGGVKAMADRITTIGKARLLRRLGSLGADDLQGINRVVSLRLGP